MLKVGQPGCSLWEAVGLGRWDSISCKVHNFTFMEQTDNINDSDFLQFLPALSLNWDIKLLPFRQLFTHT